MASIQSPLQARLEKVRERIAMACLNAGRTPESVTLIAVGKTFPAAAIREAMQAGQRHFGENYVQESIEKVAQLAALPDATELIWHFIGPIQSNKTRLIAANFQWVHSVDREKVARRLSEQRDVHLPALKVCIEINVSGESSKSGVSPAEAPALADQIAALPRLSLRGLMAIPEPTSDVSLARRRFAALRELRDQLNARGHALDTLSMGMTADMDAAIAEGATMVRIGTAIFGERTAGITH